LLRIEGLSDKSTQGQREKPGGDGLKGQGGQWEKRRFFLRKSGGNRYVPVFQCSSVPVFQCSSVPVFQGSRVPEYLGSRVPMLCRISGLGTGQLSSTTIMEVRRKK
jgi:hypothetical protein